MNIASVKRRIDALLAERKSVGGPPTAIVLLPENHRGTFAGPWPFVRRMGACAVVTYLAEDGQPTSEEIQRLVAEGEQ